MQNERIAAIGRQLDAIDALLQKEDAVLGRRVESISGWSTSEQLDHALKVKASILARIATPVRVEKPLQFIAKVIMFFGWIPRGKGRSPELLVGVPATREQLRTALLGVREQLGNLSQEQASNREPMVPHPLFGGLNAPQALRFAEVHTNHHLKIVREILAEG
ncbi:MAG: DinB family protein [Thermoanaerobaculia bacterium]